jgi:hypothetical protein
MCLQRAGVAVLMACWCCGADAAVAAVMFRIWGVVVLPLEFVSDAVCACYLVAGRSLEGEGASKQQQEEVTQCFVAGQGTDSAGVAVYLRTGAGVHMGHV